MSLTSELGDRFKTELISKIIAAISGAVLIIVLSRLLDPNGYGLLFLAISILGSVKLFSKLGIAKSTARYLADYKETDPDQIPNILEFSFILNLIIIIIVCTILFVNHGLLASLVGEPNLEPLLMIGVLFVAFGTLMTFVRKVLQGFEAIKYAAAFHATDRVLRLVFAIGFVILGYGVLGALVGFILAHTVGAILGIGYLYHRFYTQKSQTQIETGLRRRIIEYSVPVTFTSTANVLDKRFDTILIGFFIGPVGVAYYTISKQVIEFIEIPMSALGFTLSPTYEAQKSKGNTETAAKLYEETLVHALLLYIPAASGLILLAEPIIKLFFGSNYLGAILVLQVLAVFAVLRAITNLTSNGLDFLGRARDRAIIKGITALLNVLFNIILLPLVGVIGAAAATVVTYSVYTFASMYIMHTELNLHIRYISQRIRKIAIITTTMSIAVYLLVGFINGFVTLFIVVCTGVFVWALLALNAGLLDVEHIISALS